jgi:hypothetical protein
LGAGSRFQGCHGWVGLRADGGCVGPSLAAVRGVVQGPQWAGAAAVPLAALAAVGAALAVAGAGAEVPAALAGVRAGVGVPVALAGAEA